VDAITLPRRLLAEFLGTALLVTVVVGSGIAAQQLSPDDVGLQLLENSTATVFGLAVLILLLFGPVSGAHFNPVVTAADWLLGRRAGTGITPNHLAAYLVAQVVGGIAGAWLANLMFDRHVFELATKDRITTGHLVGEVVATAGLIALIFALARTGRAGLSAAAVGAYIGAAYWFTSSTSFANPAVTIGRMFSDTFAGIDPTSVPGFIAAQIVGTLIGLALIATLLSRRRPHRRRRRRPPQPPSRTHPRRPTKPDMTESPSPIRPPSAPRSLHRPTTGPANRRHPAAARVRRHLRGRDHRTVPALLLRPVRRRPHRPQLPAAAGRTLRPPTTHRPGPGGRQDHRHQTHGAVPLHPQRWTFPDGARIPRPARWRPGRRLVGRIRTRK
jgi:glycerol uptake facilitator-like aquaporin